MINPKGKKLEKLLFGIFDEAIQGVDRYNHNGSLWLIFTDELRWIVEFNNDKTLWYNYHFFKQEMDMVGLDCVEDCDIIKKWFESRFLNINPVEDTIQNGVKDTKSNVHPYPKEVRDTIQNGVKETQYKSPLLFIPVEDTIQNGVKHTSSEKWNYLHSIKDTIQNGVKHIKFEQEEVEDIRVEDTIQNGVKETTPSGYLGSIEMKGKVVHQIESPKQNNEVEDTIQNGVKEK